jgi:hypothetical protein
LAEPNTAVIEQLRAWLSMEAWPGVVKPGLLRLRDQAILSLLSTDPEKKVSDAYTKGQINVLSWFINWDQRADQIASQLVEAPANPEPEPVGTVLGPDGESTSSVANS